MTKEELMKEYQTKEVGDSSEVVIVSPRKFENMPLFVPYFWDMMMNGDGETLYDVKYDAIYTVIAITEADCEIFPELTNENDFIVLSSSDDGFAQYELLTDEALLKLEEEINQDSENITSSANDEAKLIGQPSGNIIWVSDIEALTELTKQSLITWGAEQQHNEYIYQDKDIYKIDNIIYNFKNTSINASTVMLEFYEDDPDNVRKYYKGSNGKWYCTVDDVMHVCTDAGEPLHPVKNFEIKSIGRKNKCKECDTELVYNKPNDMWYCPLCDNAEAQDQAEGEDNKDTKFSLRTKRLKTRQKPSSF